MQVEITVRQDDGTVLFQESLNPFRGYPWYSGFGKVLVDAKTGFALYGVTLGSDWNDGTGAVDAELNQQILEDRNRG